MPVPGEPSRSGEPSEDIWKPGRTVAHGAFQTKGLDKETVPGRKPDASQNTTIRLQIDGPPQIGIIYHPSANAENKQNGADV